MRPIFKHLFNKLSILFTFQDTIIIGTDLNYTPKLESTPEHVKKTKQESGKLFFEPSLTNPAKASLGKKQNHL